MEVRMNGFYKKRKQKKKKGIEEFKNNVEKFNKQNFTKFDTNIIKL